MTKPAAVQVPDPASLVATADRTVVTRRPRASHRTSEPHELLPTLRMPPVEARALRRQASGTPDADAIAIGSGEIEIDASESSGARAPAPAIDIPPPVEAAAPVEPVAESRDVQATVRVATVPVESGTTVGMPPPRPIARMHRPPLPMPDVLRNGPKPAPRTERHAEPTPELVATPAAVPDELPVIDTASLVLEMAEELSALAGPATTEPESEPEPTVEAPAELAVDSPAVAVREDAVVIAAAPAELDEPTPQPRRRGYTAIGVGLAASIAAAIWWLAPAPQSTELVDTALAPLGDQLAFVAEQTPEPEPIAKAEPTPALEPVVPEPAIVPPVEPPTLVADAALIPTPTAPVIAEEPELEPEPALDVVEPEPAVAAAAPKPAPKPKPAKSSAKKSKSKSKPKPPQPPTKVAAAPPPPAAKTVASLDPAALLREAEKAYAEGRYGTALRNAQRSLAGRNDPRAQRIVALSACKLKRESVAKTAFDRLPLGQRRSVRNTCKDAGIKL